MSKITSKVCWTPSGTADGKQSLKMCPTRAVNLNRSLYTSLSRVSMVSENVTRGARDDNRCLLSDPIALDGRTHSFHVLLCRGTMDAQFPGDLSNRQSPALGLLNSVPPCRLKWSGLPALHCRCLADSDSAVVDYRVVSIAGVHLCIECCQGRLPAPAQTVETVMWGWPVRGRSVEVSEYAWAGWGLVKGGVIMDRRGGGERPGVALQNCTFECAGPVWWKG